MSELFAIGIPFFFILAIVYGALEVGGVFKNKGVKTIIALAIAAISITNAQMVEVINQYLPYAAVFFIAFFFLGFVAKIFKGEKGKEKDWPLIMIVLGLAVILFASQGEVLRPLLDRSPLSFDNLVALLVVAIIIVMFYAAHKKKT